MVVSLLQCNAPIRSYHSRPSTPAICLLRPVRNNMPVASCSQQRRPSCSRKGQSTPTIATLSAACRHTLQRRRRSRVNSSSGQAGVSVSLEAIAQRLTDSSCNTDPLVEQLYADMSANARLWAQQQDALNKFVVFQQVQVMCLHASEAINCA